MEEKRLTADQLGAAGRAAFGARWQSSLADALGVDSSRIRGVLSGKRMSPPGWTPEILELLKERSLECLETERNLRRELDSD